MIEDSTTIFLLAFSLIWQHMFPSLNRQVKTKTPRTEVQVKGVGKRRLFYAS